MVGGHTSQGWGPPPANFAQAALAASTVETLRPLVAPARLGCRDLAVTIESEGHLAIGGRPGVQADAAAGVRRERRMVRRVVAGGPLADVPAPAIFAAMKRDPLYRFLLDGDILLDEEIAVVKPGEMASAKLVSKELTKLAAAPPARP